MKIKVPAYLLYQACSGWTRALALTSYKEVQKFHGVKPGVSNGKYLMENMDMSGQRGEPGLHITWTPAALLRSVLIDFLRFFLWLNPPSLFLVMAQAAKSLLDCGTAPVTRSTLHAPYPRLTGGAGTQRHHEKTAKPRRMLGLRALSSSLKIGGGELLTQNCCISKLRERERHLLEFLQINNSASQLETDAFISLGSFSFS
ncbi:hypothetical protein KOW79_006760 [Hemibagrus wyckioides]|uniref:Uncharacterized protein n=1 Tax=Hemibagrus wyckioides TaxID=337641 RepID=A0A9D3P0B3_9TELE|nr:hypothetical protein KOW79_006760 [Hemibagrus wyckioides]